MDTEYSQSVRESHLQAGSRTYYFDVKQTKANDYFLIITEQKKSADGRVLKKQKLILYKENFDEFLQIFLDLIAYKKMEKGDAVLR